MYINLKHTKTDWSMIIAYKTIKILQPFLKQLTNCFACHVFVDDITHHHLIYMMAWLKTKSGSIYLLFNSTHYCYFSWSILVTHSATIKFDKMIDERICFDDKLYEIVVINFAGSNNWCILSKIYCIKFSHPFEKAILCRNQFY